MNTNFLMMMSLVFFVAWRRGGDALLLFCAVFAAGLSICVMICRMETGYLENDKKSKS